MCVCVKLARALSGIRVVYDGVHITLYNTAIVVVVVEYQYRSW